MSSSLQRSRGLSKVLSGNHLTLGNNTLNFTLRKWILNHLLHVKETIGSNTRGGVCVLDSLSHFGSQDAKENKSSWPEILEVYCGFSVTLKVKCLDSLNLLLKQSAWLKSQNVTEGHPYQVGYWRWLLSYPGLRRNNHWFMTSSQHDDPIKSGTNFHPLQPLGHPQPRQKKVRKSHKMKVVFLTLLLGLVCAAQEEDAAKSSSISEVAGMIWSGTREEVVYVRVCVCVYFLWVCYVDS